MADTVLKAALDDVRAERVRLWKNKHGKRSAPEPTDKDLNWPEPMVSVTWERGYITMTLDAYTKLKAKDKKTFQQLGGLL